MSRTMKSHIKNSVVPFTVGAVEVIKANMNIDDKPLIVESKGSNWYLRKSGDSSFVVKRQNYTNMTELPKGGRVYEEAVVYGEGGGFRVHGYVKRSF